LMLSASEEGTRIPQFGKLRYVTISRLGARPA